VDEKERVYVVLGVFRPSGGLIYHWRARRNERRWQPFCLELARELEKWNPPREHLLLIGPSAGYTLPSRWLASFSSITAYDLDPLAPWFFRRNHPHAAVTFVKQNLFWIGGKLSVAPLDHVLSKAPENSVVLFANVLGQLLLEGDASEDEFQKFLSDLRAHLGSRPWASYHDQLTEERHEHIDHLTSGPWSDGLYRQRLKWSLTEQSLHWVEWVSSPS